ncbi:3670_t:CDS:2 [Funneliformis caledonium]|uniref:3670_t:CDS:1 n=1 Tax=Funneliformis caledonium TaxID=1117310 RepID=A0A9N8ZC33_9GLOM|nr:3670_t:CDS:2 [Funneliformis caledonium]
MTTYERIEQQIQKVEGKYEATNEVKKNLRKLNSQIRREKDEEERKILEGDIGDMEEKRDELEKEKEEKT